jgi:hypothetical protein
VCLESDCSYWSKSLSPNLACPYDGHTEANCAWNFEVAIDTDDAPGGWREFRMTGNMKTPDGLRFFNSSGIPIYFANGKSESNYNRFCGNTSLIGRGWYEGFGYSNAVIECVPREPVSGTVTFRFRQQNSSEGGRLRVFLDRTHHIPAAAPWPEISPRTGEVLFDKTGSFTSFQSLSIDTTRLANGWHSFAVLADNPNTATSECSYCQGEENRASGVAKVWFFVAN